VRSWQVSALVGGAHREDQRRPPRRPTVMREAGLRAFELKAFAFRRIAFPHPSDAVALDPPELDYRCGGSAGFGRIRTGLPVYPSARADLRGRRARNEHLTPRKACLRARPGVKSDP